MTGHRMFPNLFKPGNIGRLEIKNRIIKAPTMQCLSNPDGSVTDILIRHYAEIARGGCGLIIVEASSPVKGFIGLPCQLCAGGIEYLPGLSQLTQVICDNGAKAALQIVPSPAGFPPKVPSRIAPEEQEMAHWYEISGSSPVPEELTIEEIQEIVSATGNAAKLAQLAGFDMIEILAGHGALPHQFLSPARNIRNDLYGGSPKNRMRFLVELVRDIKKKTGADFPLSVRLSSIDYEPGGLVLKDTLEIMKVLEQVGVDVIHVSGGSHANLVHLTSPMSIPAGHHVAAAEAAKKVVHIPVIASGSITTPELAEEILESGKADFVSFARTLFADPYWPEKARQGRPEDITPCIRCNDGCQDRTNLSFRAIQCTVNADFNREDMLAINPAERRKNVAVVGGGPAGLEAARVCALRGHKVTLYEKRILGGALIEASIPEFKSDLKRLISYYVTQMKKLKVNVIQEEASVNTIKDGKFDAVIVAVGAALKKPDVPGLKKAIVTDALEVLKGKSHLGKRVLIIGAGLVGIETGLFLAEQGKKITFIEMLDDIMSGVGSIERHAYEDKLAESKVTIYTGMQIESVLDKGAVVVDKNLRRQNIPADNIVLATGFTSQTTMKERLEKETNLEVYAIGDCLNPGMIYDAIHGGYLTARKI